MRKALSFKAWLKSKSADKVLSPVRKQLVDLIDKNSSVIEIGCGTGDLLLRASMRISHGLGVDLEPGMIEFANKKIREHKADNLEFICKDIKTMASSSLQKFNIATSTLCLHEMYEEDAVFTLSLLGKYTTKIIVADYSEPHTWWGRLSIEMDEMISGHYSRFRSYRANGRISCLAQKAGLSVASETKTQIDGIHIWVLNGENKYNKGH